AVEQLPLGRWSLLAGARVDVRRLEADSNAALALGAETRDYTAYSGDVGVVWRLAGGLSLVANLGRAWRARDLFVVFSNGPPLAVLSLRGQADYVHGADDRTRRPLPLMPPLRATLEAELHWRRGDGGNSYAGMETELVARQTRLASDSIPGQGFVTVDIPTA